MKKLIKFSMLIAVSFSLTSVFNACSEDKPDPIILPDDPEIDEDQFEDLYGFWINSDKSGAIEIVKNTAYSCKTRYYVYNDKIAQKYQSVEWSFSGGNASFVALCPPKSDGMSYNVSVKISSHSYNKLILKEGEGQGDHLSSYVFSRVTETDFYDYLTNGGNASPTNKISASEFVGIWRYAGVVFDFKENGACTLYALTSTTSNYYSKLYAGTWNFDSSTNVLTVKSATYFSSSTNNSDEWTIKDINSNKISTNRLDFTRETTLPQKEQTTQSSQLAGTNWSANIDGDYVVLSFYADGTFTETYAGEKSKSTYTELDETTIIIGDGTVMSNTFGEEPFNFKLNYNKTSVTFSNKYEKWTLTRKQ